MFDAEDILNGLIRGTLSGRRKSSKRTRRAMRGGSLVNAKTILAAAGVAWGLFETWQQSQRQQTSTPPPAAGSDRQPAAPPPPRPAARPLTTPPPIPTLTSPAAPSIPIATSDHEALPPELLQLLRLMISAARADGEIGPAEQDRILAEAREVGAEAEVRRELAIHRPLGEIVAGARDPELCRQLYALAFTIVRADQAVSGGERIYLTQLAHRLGLDDPTVEGIEAETSARIDAASAGDEA